LINTQKAPGLALEPKEKIRVIKERYKKGSSEKGLRMNPTAVATEDQGSLAKKPLTGFNGPTYSQGGHG